MLRPGAGKSDDGTGKTRLTFSELGIIWIMDGVAWESHHDLSPHALWLSAACRPCGKSWDAQKAKPLHQIL